MTGVPKEHGWTRLYEKALSEVDDYKRLDLIALATGAVFQRKQEIAHSLRAHVEELAALEGAAYGQRSSTEDGESMSELWGFIEVRNCLTAWEPMHQRNLTSRFPSPWPSSSQQGADAPNPSRRDGATYSS